MSAHHLGLVAWIDRASAIPDEADSLPSFQLLLPLPLFHNLCTLFVTVHAVRLALTTSVSVSFLHFIATCK